MKGKMLIDLSQELMVEVVQEWFDRHTHNLNGKVVEVVDSPDSDPPMFYVKIVPVEEEVK